MTREEYERQLKERQRSEGKAQIIIPDYEDLSPREQYERDLRRRNAQMAQESLVRRASSLEQKNSSIYADIYRRYQDQSSPYREDAAEWYDKLSSASDSYQSEYDKMLASLNRHKGYIDEDWKKNFTDYLNAGKTYYDQALEQASADKEFESQFGSQYAYDNLLRMQENKQATDTMSAEELKAKADEEKNQQALSSKAYERMINDRLAVGDYNIADLQEKMDEAKKREQGTDRVLYYDQNGFGVTYDRLYREKTAENTWTNLTSDTEAYKLYEKIKEEEPVIMAQAQSGDDSPAVGNDMAVLLADKQTLAQMGYDYDEIAYYQKYKADREGYQESLKDAENASPIKAAVFSIATAPMQSAEYAGNAFYAAMALGKDDSAYGLANVYDDKFRSQASTMLQGATQMINDYLRDTTGSELVAWLGSGAYSGVVSSMQSMAQVAVCRLLFPVGGEAISLGLMASNAANQQFAESIKAGATNGEALLTSLGAGVNEALFEKLSIENLDKIDDIIKAQRWDYNGFRAFFRSVVQNSPSMLVQGLTEGSEEFFTDVANAIWDNFVNGENSEYHRTVKEYMDQGYDSTVAGKMATQKFFADLASSFYGGFIGGLSSGSTHVLYGTARIGVNNTLGASALGREISKNNNVDILLNEANELGDADVTQRVQKITQSENPSNRQVGRLAQEVYSKTAKNIIQEHSNAFASEVENKLSDLDEAERRQAVDVVSKYQRGEFLTSKERKLFSKVGGQDLIDSIIGDEEAMGRIRASVEESPEYIKNQERLAETSILSDVDVKEMRSVESSKTKKAIDEAKANAKNIKDIQEAKEETARDFMKKMGYRQSTMNAVMAEIERTGKDINDIGGFLLGVNEAINYGKIGYQQKYIKNNTYYGTLTKAQQDFAYKLGVTARDEQLAEEQTRRDRKLGTLAKRTGKVHLMESADKAITALAKSKDKNDQAKFNSVIKARDVLSFITQNITHGNIYLFASEKDASGKYVLPEDLAERFKGKDERIIAGEIAKQNGIYDSATGDIYIDVNAGTGYEGVILMTAAHELTHFIRDWSPVKFRVLGDFLIGQYQEANVPVKELIQRRMQATGASYDEAYEETVADSMERMLTDENVYEKLIALKAKDSDVFTKLKEGLKQIVQSIKNAYRQFEENQTVEGYLAQTVKDLDRLQTLFAEALVDAGDVYSRASEMSDSDAFMDSKTAVLNQIRTPYTEGTNEWKDFVEGLNPEARKVHDLFYNFYTLSKLTNVKNRTGNTVKKLNISSVFMTAQDWNEQIKKDSKWGDCAKKLAESLPPKIRERMHMNLDGSLNYDPLETEFKMAKSLAQRLVDALGYETIDNVYDLDGHKITLTTNGAVQSVGGEAYRRAVIAETRKLYKEGRLRQVNMDRMSKDLWGSLGFLAVNTKTGASGDFTTICPQMMFNRGCYYCYRRAALTTGVNNKLVAESVWYTGEILRIKQKDIDALNEDGGLRIQSFGDWMPHFSAQLADVIYDAELRGLQVKIITKEPSMIEYVAKLREQGLGKNLYFNLSADYAIEKTPEKFTANTNKDSLDAINPSRPYMRNDDGMWWKRAMTVEEAYEYHKKYPWVNVRIVATTQDEFIRGLKDPRVYVVTGYHGNIREWERIDSTTGEKKLIVEPLGDAGMPWFIAHEDGTWSIDPERMGKNKNQKALGQRILDEGLVDLYYKKTCCIFGRCDQCKGKCGQAANTFYAKNALNDDQDSVAYWADNMTSEQIRKNKKAGKEAWALYNESTDSDSMLDWYHKTYGTPQAKFSTRDTEYLELAKDPQKNRAKLIDMVDQAAKEWGAIKNEREDSLEFYHGSPNLFTKFDGKKAGKNGTADGQGFYFATNFGTSLGYSYGRSKNRGHIYNAYLKIDNPLRSGESRLSYDERKRLFIEMDKKKMNQGYGYDDSYLKQVYFADIIDETNYDEHAERFIHSFDGYDDAYFYANVSFGTGFEASTSTMLENGYDGSIVDHGQYGDAVLVFSPSQIKSADPVTYDDDGNVIPLSERFNEKSEDIRLSERVKQDISSADTSLDQIPALFTDKRVKFGKTNIDIGGGRFDRATNYLAEQGTTNYVFDPFNRDASVNRKALDVVMNGGADTATCANVLNVIAEKEARENVILEVAKSIKPDGTAYFMVYEGDGSGVGRETSKGYQNNRKTADYVDEISEYFDNVERHGKLIVATQPKANLPKAAWQLDNSENPEVVRFSTRDYWNGDEYGVYSHHPLMVALKEAIESEKSADNWSKDAIKNLYRDEPEFNYIERLQNGDLGAYDELDVSLLDFIEDPTVISDMKWYLVQAVSNDLVTRENEDGVIEYVTWMQKNAEGVRKFVRHLDARAREIAMNRAKKSRPIPTSLQIAENTRMEAKELRTVFDMLNNNKDLNDLADKVFPLVEKLNLAIVFTKKADNQSTRSTRLGFYMGEKSKTTGKNGLVAYNAEYFNGSRSDADKAETILHELIHACTVYVQNYRYVENEVGTMNNIALKNADAEAKILFNDVKRLAKNNPSLSNEYGMTNAKEFLAELSNMEFRRKLAALQTIVTGEESDQISFGFNSKEKEALIILDKFLTLFDDSLYLNYTSNAVYRKTKRVQSILYSTRNLEAQKQLAKVNEQLKAENEQLKADFADIKELLALQGKVTGGKLIKKSSAEAIAKRLFNSLDLEGDVREFADLLVDAYGYIQGTDNLSWEDVQEKIGLATEWAIEHQKEQKVELSQEAKALLRRIRESRVSVSDAMKANAANQYGSYNNWRKAMMGSITISNDAPQTLDQLWQELSAEHPEFFDPEASEAEMPLLLADAIAAIKEQGSEDFYFGQTAMTDQDIFNEIYNGYWDVATLKTVADKDQAKMNALKKAHAERMQKLRKAKNEAIANLKKEASEGRAKLKAEYRERLEKQRADLTEQFKARTEKARERRTATELRHRITKKVAELNKLLLSPDSKHHVPKDLRPLVAEALDALDLTSPRQGEKTRARLNALKDMYEKIANTSEPTLQYAYDDDIMEMIKAVSDNIGDTPFQQMSVEQLADLYHLYSAVMATVRNANKTFAWLRNRDITELSEDIMSEVKTVGGAKEVQAKWKEFLKRNFYWNNLKPVYAMRAIGSDTLMKLFENVRRGEDVYGNDVAEAKSFAQAQKEKYGYDSWNLDERTEFKTADGKSFSLNVMEMMSLYEYYKRPQADAHLRQGGFVFEDSTITKKNALGMPIEYKVNTADTHRVDPSMMVKIAKKLTPEQKGFADAMQKYLAEVMGAKGNEISEALYDIDLYNEEHYFPLKSSKIYLASKATETAGDKAIKNAGMTKALVPNANNPIILQGLMDVWADHVNEMSMYHAFVLPLEDFQRVYNYKTSASNENASPEGVKSVIRNAYGDAANSYIHQMLVDLNGGARVDPRAGLSSQLISKFKSGAVLASASVVIQQPSAVVRAFAYIDPKYFLKTSLENLNLKEHSAEWEEAKRYAPVAKIKEMGYFDTGMGTSTQEWMKEDIPEGFANKAKALVTDSNYRSSVLAKAPELADELTWTHIWKAAKAQTLAENPSLVEGSEEHLEKAGELFTKTVVNTQVYDSVLSRSAMMRSKDGLVKTATAFMAEPTTSINMIVDALIQAKRMGSGKEARRIIASVLGQIILNAMLVSIVYAARDDDDEKTYIEKYIGQLAKNTLDNANPMTMIPYLKDIVSLIQGYDVERADMSVIADIIQAYRKLTSGEMSFRKVEDFAGQVLKLFGIPFQNIMRDIRGIENVINGFMSDNTTSLEGIRESVLEEVTGNSATKIYGNDLSRAVKSGDSEKIKTVIDKWIKQKMKSGKTEKEAKSSIQSTLTSTYKPLFLKAYQKKDQAEMARIRKALQATGIYKDVVKTTQDWIKSLKE